MKRQNSYLTNNRTKPSCHLMAGLTNQRPIVKIEYNTENTDFKGRANKNLNNTWGVEAQAYSTPIIEVKAGEICSGKRKGLRAFAAVQGVTVKVHLDASEVVCKAMAGAEALPSKLMLEKPETLTSSCKMLDTSSHKLASANIDVVELANKGVDDIVDALFEDVDDNIITRRMGKVLFRDDEVEK